MCFWVVAEVDQESRFEAGCFQTSHCFEGVRQKKRQKNPPEWTGGFCETISDFIMLSKTCLALFAEAFAVVSHQAKEAGAQKQDGGGFGDRGGCFGGKYCAVEIEITKYRSEIDVKHAKLT